MASEKVTLYGLPLVSERPVLFSSIDPEPVSYTHLDVYKRQTLLSVGT